MSSTKEKKKELFEDRLVKILSYADSVGTSCNELSILMHRSKYFRAQLMSKAAVVRVHKDSYLDGVKIVLDDEIPENVMVFVHRRNGTLVSMFRFQVRD